MSARRRIAVLVSGGGRSLENLAAKIASGELDARIVLVIANTPTAFALERARLLELPSVVIDHRAFDGAQAFSDAVFAALDASEAELALLAGFLRQLVVPRRWSRRMLNIHPALLPKFGGKGMYGERVHKAVLEARETVSGCTVHYVTDEYDSGPIVVQRRVPVHVGDTAHDLAARVFEEEKIALPAAIAMHFGGEAGGSAS